MKPRQLVIMDHLSAHKRPAVRQAIEAVGARVVFLPRYSPDFNPAELAISVIKQALRRVEAKTREALEAELRATLDDISPREAVTMFRHCGYSVQYHCDLL